MESVKLRVARRDPETDESGWSEFEVEVREKTTVLDCLDRVQHTQDPSLGFRYACRVGMCGSCAMVVNGKDRWTCRTLVRDLGAEEIRLEPLRNLPVIRDLAVDFSPLWRKYRQIRPAFEYSPAGAPRVLKAETRRLRERIDSNIQCISCGACYSSCGYVASDPLYLGPHALNRVFTLNGDMRDDAREKRLDIIDNEHGCWKCHVQMNCTEVCPMELSPSAGIQHLKRALLHRRVLSPSRRYFAFTAVGAAVAAVTGFVAYRPKMWVDAGPLDAISSETFSAFQQGERNAFLRRTADGGIEALSQRCSHQGCRVQWNESENEFHCPCHRGIFDQTGTPISGPPNRPLDRYETRIESGSVQVCL
jgi:succinate dehydrogenase/fumarate reductase iron-sulfur protein